MSEAHYFGVREDEVTEPIACSAHPNSWGQFNFGDYDPSKTIP